MILKKQILELLEQKPGLDSTQIAETLGAKVNSVKVTLCKMIAKEQVTRVKEAKEAKAKNGPQNTYRYKIKTD